MKARSAAKKGFTLVEVIVVLVILVVLAGATYGTMKAFITRAEQSSRDIQARTLFMAAQSALTHAYANDPDLADSLAQNAAPVTFGSINPQPDSAEWALERQQNGENLVSLSSNGGAGAALLALIGPYVDDKTVLDDNILIEFNKVSGNVLACFYSDETALSHGTSGYNVYERGAGSLKAGLVGYYGVEYTGSRAARQVVEEAEEEPEQLSVWLVDYDGTPGQGNGVNGGHNYGLLAIECALPADAPDDALFTVSLSSSNGNNWYVTLGGAGAAVQTASLGTNLTNALNNPISYRLGGGQGQGHDNRERHAVVFRNPEPCADGRTLIVIVLDSQVTGADIQTLYPDVAGGYLVATLAGEVASTGMTYDTATSEPEHALYADLNDAGTAYVSSVRHLNNVRYTMNGTFEQTRDITMIDYADAAFAMPAIGFGNKNNQTRFTGAYNGRNYEISGLTMPANTANAGLFYYIGSGGRAEHIKLVACNLSGSALAGGVAATNAGTINKCTVYSATKGSGVDYSVVATGSSGVAGGVAAVNDGTIQACYVGVGVKATMKAGGVAGVSSGNISYCEVATAFAAKVNNDAGDMVGTPYFGAKSGSAYDYGEREGVYAMDNNQRWVLTTAAPEIDRRTFRATSGLSGGIVGEQTGGLVSYCVNASHVGSNQGVAGGITGLLDLDSQSDVGITACYNAGVVDATTYAGGLIGQLFTGTLELSYNTAPVNVFITALQMRDGCYLPVQTVHGTEDAGGVAGRVNQETRITDCYSASYVYAGANTPYAGVFGRVATGSRVSISNCYFLRNALNTVGSCTHFAGDHYVPLDSAMERAVHIETKYGMEHAVIRSTLRVYLDQDGNNPGVGPYFKINAGMSSVSPRMKPYYFPAFDVNTGVCALGKNFHRTPYYPVLQEYGRVELDNSDGDYFYATCYVLDQAATLKLTINIGLLIPRDYVFTLSGGVASDEASATGRTMTASGYLIGTVTISGIEGTAVPLNPGDDLYALGYRQKYVLKIPKDQPGVTDWYPNTVYGAMQGPSAGTTLLWWETSEIGW